MAVILGTALVGCRDATGVFVEAGAESLPPVLVSEVCAAPSSVHVTPKAKVTNQAQFTRHMMLVSRNCSCVSVQANGKPWEERRSIYLEPLKSVELAFPSRLPPEPGLRALSSRIEISSIDEPVVELRWTVEVVANVQATPSRFDERFERNDTVRHLSLSLVRHARIDPRSAAPPRLEGIIPEWVGVTSIERSGSPQQLDSGLWRDEWSAVVKIAAPTEGRGHAILRVCFDGSAPESVDIPIHATRSIGVEAPQCVYFNAQPASSKRRLLLRALDGHPFRVQSFQATSTRINASAVSDRPATRHWIEVSLARQGQERVDERLAIVTDHADAPRLNVRIVAQASAAN